MEVLTRRLDIDEITDEQREMVINELKHLCVDVKAPREITSYFELFPMAIRLGNDYFLSLADQIQRKLDCFVESERSN